MIIISVLGYSLQGTLIVAFSRRVDPLSLAVYRNLSLIFTMSPLLLIAPWKELAAIPYHIPEIILTGIIGTLGLAVMFRSVRYLPVGISSGIRQAAGVLSSVLFGILFYKEQVSLLQFLAILILLVGLFVLSKSKNPMPHLVSNALLGFILSLISGIFIALAFFMMSKLAREVGPAVSGYFLEASIGICSLVMLRLRNLLLDKKRDKIPKKTLLKIALASSPTLVGTGAAAWAVTLGPFGLMRAYTAAGILVTIFLSHIIYKEHLRFFQWIGIVITIAGIIVLRLG